ncbi:MAG: PaaI family thioesterase [Acidimicrobiia bacterium]|nr:PaaI family thioesterase [Acidimicrobiia bacterium]MDH4308679.1 PaaI family thioesterase [Acidimicrobiia bacterium]MDH5295300.1 PaaI family thioesterase [Acidimicrobiia bacterium]
MAAQTSPELVELVERVQAAYGHACFACGRHNLSGLHLRLAGLEGDWIVGEFEPADHHRGAPDVLHGGIAATALDEILVWAGIASCHVMTVTGTLNLRYRKPLGVGSPITARARVVERRGRRMTMEGALEVDGATATEASGLYLVTATIDEVLAGS